MKLMYFQFSSHLLLFAWRLPPPTGKKDFFRRGFDDDEEEEDDVEEEKNIVRRLSPHTRERKFEQNMGK